MDNVTQISEFGDSHFTGDVLFGSPTITVGANIEINWIITDDTNRLLGEADEC